MQCRKEHYVVYWLTTAFLLYSSTCLVCCQADPSDDEPVVECGDSVIGGDEECEDGNAEDWDGCNDCMISEFIVGGGVSECPDIATAQSGETLVVWLNSHHDGPNYAIHGQRLNSLGEKLGKRFAVVDGSADSWPDIGCPSLATRSDGSFFVAWTYFGNSNRGVLVRHFAADGTALGRAVRVDDGPPDWFVSPIRAKLAATGDSGLVVVWSQPTTDPDTPDFSVQGRMLDGEGNPAGDVLLIESVEGFDQIEPAVVMDDSGNFTVLWTDKGGEGGGDIKGRRFDSAGNPLDEVFTVNTTTAGPQAGSSISPMPDGGFIAVWEGDARIYGQVFDAAATPRGEEFRSDLDDGGYKYFPDVAPADDGSFIVAWIKHAEFSQVEARLYSPEGTPASPPMLTGLNGNACKLQGDSAATAVDADGNYWVAWSICPMHVSMGCETVIQRIDSAGEQRGVLPW